MVFRKLTCLLSAVLLMSACSADVNEAELNGDDRFDLLPVVMKPILETDARKCTKFYNMMRNAEADGEEELQAVFEKAVDFWAQVNAKLLNPGSVSKDLVRSVIISADGPNRPASIFPEGLVDRNIPTNVSRICGEYAGVSFVGAGLMGFGESAMLAETVNPGFYADRGMDYDFLLARIDEIENGADGLSSISQEDVVTCVAAYKAMKHADSAHQSHANVWLVSLTKRIESGDIMSDGFADGNSVWNALTTRGFDAVADLENFEAVSGKCKTWADEAVSKQQAEL